MDPLTGVKGDYESLVWVLDPNWDLVKNSLCSTTEPSRQPFSFFLNSAVNSPVGCPVIEYAPLTQTFLLLPAFYCLSAVMETSAGDNHGFVKVPMPFHGSAIACITSVSGRDE